MGVNLVTRVRSFSIETRTFPASDHDVQDGCVTPGTHKLLRFDFLSHNAGDADLVIGSPAARPDLFVWSSGHGHYHLKDFNEFLFFDATGNLATVGYKQAFCAIDIERIGPNASATGRFHNCNSDQGISAGWADVYSAFLPCQYVVIDGLPNGDYTLQSTTNAQHRVGEDCFGDNTIWTGLRITGNSVQVIDPPYIPEDRIPFNRANLAVIQAGGRWKVAEGNHWMLDTGTSQAEAQRALDIINHYKLASLCFVGRPRCGDVSPTHWLLDFGPGQGNAIAALHFIRKYRFNQICFVGRPDPSMTYFKTSRGRPGHIDVLDPRRIEAIIDPPVWWHQQPELVGRQAPTLDIGRLCIGSGPSRREENGFVLTVQDADSSEVLERHDIVGLATTRALQVDLPGPAGVVDVGIAHFGTPPTVHAYSQDEQVATAEADDRQRHIENLRLVADRIDRVVIMSEDGEALLNYIRTQPATGKKPRRRSSSR